MNAQELARFYQHHIKRLSVEDRLRLLAIIADEQAKAGAPEAPRERSVLELEGLGAELWEGVDAQEYVNQLRGEWDLRP